MGYVVVGVTALLVPEELRCLPISAFVYLPRTPPSPFP